MPSRKLVVPEFKYTERTRRQRETLFTDLSDRSDPRIRSARNWVKKVIKSRLCYSTDLAEIDWSVDPLQVYVHDESATSEKYGDLSRAIGRYGYERGINVQYRPRKPKRSDGKRVELSAHSEPS